MWKKAKRFLAVLLALTLMLSVVDSEELFVSASATNVQEDTGAGGETEPAAGEETKSTDVSVEEDTAVTSVGDEGSGEVTATVPGDGTGTGTETGGAADATGTGDTTAGESGKTEETVTDGTTEAADDGTDGTTTAPGTVTDGSGSEGTGMETETGENGTVGTEDGNVTTDGADDETDTASVEENSDSAAEDETEEQPVRYTAQVDQDDQQVNVIVDVPAGAFDTDMEPKLHASLLTEQDEVDKAAAEVAEQTDAEFDGMLVLDVYFTDGDTDIEIDPAVPVSVRFELPEGVLPENIDPSTLTVHHLAETDDNGDTAVQVETVATSATDDGVDGIVALSADAAEAADASGEVNLIDDLPDIENETEGSIENPAVVAEFEVESFSRFTITWGNSLFELDTLYVFCAEINNGEIVEINAGQPLAGTDAFSWEKGVAVSEIDVPEIDGYQFTGKAYLDNAQTEIQRIQYGGKIWNMRWQYTQDPEGRNGWNDIGDHQNVYFIYQPDLQEGGGLSIEDTIMQNGSLTAALSNPETDAVSYKWYRSADPEQQNYVEVEGETESTLFVAEDGARHYYYVEAVLEDGTTLKSEVFQVSYYDSLQNGSFENPERGDVDRAYQLEYRESYFMQIPNGTEGLIWKTTAEGEHFDGDLPDDYYTEIVRSTNGNSRFAYGIRNAAEGNQFAELNCETAGALYQDVLTVPGSTLYWGLEHSDRSGGQDSRLLVLINDTSELPDDFDPTNYSEIESLGLEDNIVLDTTTSEVRWQYHSGSYVVPEGQYVTRFYFVAGNGDTEGNLLDNITFSSELPKPPVEKGNIVLNKALVGVDNSTTDLAGVDFTFTVGADGQEIQTVTLNENNNWTGIITVDPGTYTITENTPVSEIDEYTYESTTISGGVVDGLSTTVSVEGGSSELVVYTNTYKQDVVVEPIVSDPDIRKYVDDKEDGTYDLSLDVKGTTGKESVPINVLYVLDESYSMMWDMNGHYPGTDSENPSGDNQYPEDSEHNPIAGRPPYNYSYVRFNAAKQAIERLNNTLKDDGNLDVQVAMVTFAENGNNPEDYTGKYIKWADLDSSGLDLPVSEWNTFASGTNYKYALEQAQNMINEIPNDRKNAETVVIFVTDGEPNWPRGTEDPKEAAAAALEKLDCDRFYAVGVGSDIGNEYLSELVKNVKNGVVADSFQSGDTSELVSYFSQIAADIAGVDTHNVTITDTFSAYAELVDASAVPTITIKNTSDEQITVNAPASLVNNNEIYTGIYTFEDGGTHTLTYTYNSGTKTFTLYFGEGYALTKDWIYTITVVIRPTETAKTEYVSSGYGDTKGDLNTDVPGSEEDEWTSSGKAGFYFMG